MYLIFKTNLLIAIVFLSSSFCRPIEDELAQDYIDNYKELAVVEMHRSGIPASIILAQGLHESNYGLSKLATDANNHFGIKCKAYWVGKTYYHKDDDFNKAGKLLESCFRSYSTALESYVDHSNFLMLTKHYSNLFNYDKTDYKAWAYGLKESGYATDIAYSEKLIEKIEKYYLNQYDYWESPYRTTLKD
jgi:flagellum-specific peptidoglycan hydrolase FlgJ